MSPSSGYRAGRNGRPHLHGARRAAWKVAASATRQARAHAIPTSTQPAGRPQGSTGAVGALLVLLAVIFAVVLAVNGIRALLPHDNRTPEQKMYAACDTWRRTGQVSISTRDLADAAEEGAPSSEYNEVHEDMWTVWQYGDGVTASPDVQVVDGYGPTTFADELTAACKAAAPPPR